MTAIWLTRKKSLCAVALSAGLQATRQAAARTTHTAAQMSRRQEDGCTALPALGMPVVANVPTISK